MFGRNSVFIHGVTLEQVRACLKSAATENNRHAWYGPNASNDPLNYFSFSVAPRSASTIAPLQHVGHEGIPNCVEACKGGADAAYYIEPLARRLRECGLTGFVITASNVPPDKAAQ